MLASNWEHFIDVFGEHVLPELARDGLPSMISRSHYATIFDMTTRS
jgi:hypothetical protein